MNTLEELSNIADELDKRGLVQLANVVTDVMYKVAQFNPTNQNSAPNKQNNVSGQYDKDVWKQTFSDKYKRLTQLIEGAKNVQSPMDINPTVAQGLYDEMVYIASNYLKDDQDVFNAMKSILPAYEGLFS